MLGSQKYYLQNIDCTHSNWMVYILSVTLRMEDTKNTVLVCFGSGDILSVAILARILSSANNIFGNPARILSFAPSLCIVFFNQNSSLLKSLRCKQYFGHWLSTV